MRIFFREFFGHVEPASSARCKLHFGCIWTQKPPRDMAKMIPFSFSFFLPFIFRATSDTHNFQFFHPLFRAPPRHPNLLLDGLGLSPASLSLSFLIIFHCRPLLGHPKMCNFQGGARRVVSFYQLHNFLRASC